MAARRKTRGPRSKAASLMDEPLQPQIPRATYRLQFTEHFTFRDTQHLVPYLDALGIEAAYASPILKARTGSMHGYDICDHRQLNPQLGTNEDFAALSSALR